MLIISMARGMVRILTWLNELKHELVTKTGNARAGNGKVF